VASHFNSSDAGKEVIDLYGGLINTNTGISPVMLPVYLLRRDVIYNLSNE